MAKVTSKSLKLSGIGGITPSKQNTFRVNTPGNLEDGSSDDPQGLSHRIEILEQDRGRRQESYARRERAYKQRIEELEEEIANQKREKSGWMKSQDKIAKLKEMQGQILHRVELVQDRTAKILQEQERDLLRAFRARLFDVQTELEKEKSKKDDGAVAWIERSRRLEAEVEWAKEVADRLERVNKSLQVENNQLKAQFQSAKQEHTFTLEKLGAISSENGRLVAECHAIDGENKSIKAQYEINKKIMEELRDAGVSSTQASKGGLHAVTGRATHDAEEKFKESNMRLRKQLNEEKKALTGARQQYANELKARTEMELLLRTCVEDVRREIARRNIESVQFVPGADMARLFARKPGSIPSQEFLHDEEDRAMELLLSQERVVTLVYRKAFPLTNKTKTKLLTQMDGSSENKGGVFNTNNNNNSMSLPMVGLLPAHEEESSVVSAVGPERAGSSEDINKLPNVHTRGNK